MPKVSHCCKAALTVIGFCSKCKEPCDHIEDAKSKKMEDMMRMMGMDPSILKS